jgi:hypothetical protein
MMKITPTRQLTVLVVLCTLALSSHAQSKGARASARDSATSNGADTVMTKRSASEFSVQLFGAYGFHRTSFTSLPPFENCCNGFSSTSALGYGAQLGLTLPLGSTGLLLGARAGVMSMPASFVTTTTQKIYAGQLQSVDAVFEYTTQLAWNGLTGGLALEYPISSRLFIGAGVEGMYVLSATYTQQERIISPTSAVVYSQSNDIVRDDRSGNLERYNAFVVGLNATARLRVLEPDRSGIHALDLVARYNYALTPLYSEGLSWTDSQGSKTLQAPYTLHYLSLGIALVIL